MRLYRIKNPTAFDSAPEVAMDVHFADRRNGEFPYYIVVGGRVAISTHEEPGTPIEGYLDQPWLKPNLPLDEREELLKRGWVICRRHLWSFGSRMQAKEQRSHCGFHAAPLRAAVSFTRVGFGCPPSPPAGP